jgi:hypothetical protein
MVSNFFGTEIEIWACFGLVGNTEEKNWADCEQLFRAVFSCFMGKFFFNFKKYFSVRYKKLHKMKVKKT